MVDSNRIEGSVENIAGKAQEAAGRMTGNYQTQAEGKVRQARGAMRDAYGQLADNAQGAAENANLMIRQRPMGSLLTTGMVFGAVGFLIGRLTSH